MFNRLFLYSMFYILKKLYYPEDTEGDLQNVGDLLDALRKAIKGPR